MALPSPLLWSAGDGKGDKYGKRRNVGTDGQKRKTRTAVKETQRTFRTVRVLVVVATVAVRVLRQSKGKEVKAGKGSDSRTALTDSKGTYVVRVGPVSVVPVVVAVPLAVGAARSHVVVLSEVVLCGREGWERVKTSVESVEQVEAWRRKWEGAERSVVEMRRRRGSGRAGSALTARKESEGGQRERTGHVR